MRRLLAVFAVGMVAILFSGLATSPAQAEATFETAPIENGYPKNLTFKLTATSTVEIKDVTLAYKLVGRNSSALGKPEPGAFTAGTKVTTTVIVDTNPNTNWIPVGNELLWHWELTLADGMTASSKEESYLYLPSGKDWKSAKNDVAVVYYTGQRDNLANTFLQAMQTIYEKHGRGLLKTDLERKPVKLLLLGDSKEINDASPSKGSTFDNSRTVVTCGFRPGSANDIIFAAISCGVGDPADTVRHEFGHILNAAAGEGTLVKLPLWLDEGLAVYAQEKQDDYSAAFDAASRRQKLIPFRDMATPVSDQNQVILQYGESYRMVKYLIDKFGQAKLIAMLAATKKDTRFDVALKNTYGFDLDGFEKEFTASLGGAQPTAAPTQQPQQQQPTRPAATAAPRAQATAQATTTAQQLTTSGDDGISKTTVVMVGIAIVLLLCAVFAFLISMFLQNSRQGPV